MDNRNAAVELLAHYFALAMGHKGSSGLSMDQRLEITQIVDHIITAASEEMEARRKARAEARARAASKKTEDPPNFPRMEGNLKVEGAQKIEDVVQRRRRSLDASR